MTEPHKTIFLCVTRGGASRSYLRSDFLKTLLKDERLRVVILVYILGEVKEYFKKEFEHPRVVIDTLSQLKYGRARKFLMHFFSMLIYSRAEYRHLKYGGIGHRKKSPFLLFLLQHGFYTVLDKLTFLRPIARWIEKHVFKDRAYGELFEKYDPDIVFCTTIAGTIDVALMKEAYHRGIPTISTPKSWDTVTRNFFRFPSEKVVVANEWMKGIIADEQLIPRKDISVAGLIQFDVYAKKKQFLSHEEFCARSGLDPLKPIILFAPEGLLTGDAERYVRELIADPQFLATYNLIIRPHFSDIRERRYEEFRGIEGIFLDQDNMQVTNMFYDFWDPTIENAEWQAEVIHASSVIVCFMSTMVIDAHILNKPVVVIQYEPEGTTRAVPIELLYTFRHFEALLEMNSTSIAKDKSEVVRYIDRYIKDPSHEERERAALVEKFAGVMDGKAGERTAEAVIDYLIQTSK